MSQPARKTGKSIQVAVRLPWALYDAMKQRSKPIARQIIETLENDLFHKGGRERTRKNRLVSESGAQDKTPNAGNVGETNRDPHS